MERLDPVIRLLSADDLDEALGLSTVAGWNQRLADWRTLLQLAPAGSFAAAANGRIIGTAIGIDYGAFGWIAMMLVDPGWRGRGVGARLLESAMAAVPPGTPIRLDATPLGRPLYRRHGFEDEAALTRHVAEPSRPRVDASPTVEPGRVRRLERADLPAVTAQDDRIFGADRRILLEWALGDAPQYAHLIETGAGANYSFGRAGRLFDQIGPVVAADESRAQALVSAALRAADARAVVVDTFDRHAGFTDWLRGQGFSAARPLFRMCRGAWAGNGRGSRGLAEYASLGPEFG